MKKQFRHWRLLAALTAASLLVVAFLIAGCGGGDQSTGPAMGEDKANLTPVTIRVQWPKPADGRFIPAFTTDIEVRALDDPNDPSYRARHYLHIDQSDVNWDADPYVATGTIYLKGGSTYYLRAEAFDEGGGDYPHPVQSWLPIAGGQTEIAPDPGVPMEAQVTMDVEATITGTVQDEWGSPIEGVEIYCDGGNVGTTDAGGTFSVSVPADTVCLEFEHPDYFHKDLRVYANPPTVDLGTITLYNSATVTGHVLDGQTLAPIEGATVELSADATPVSTQTDADGAFSFTAIPPGTYDIEISKDGYDTIWSETDVGSPFVDLGYFTMYPPGALGEMDLVGHVHSWRSSSHDYGDPIQGASVSIDGETLATTDKIGGFRIRNVPSGNHLIRAEADGFVAVERLVPHEDVSYHHVFLLPLVATVSGRVVDGETGNPIAGAVLTGSIWDPDLEDYVDHSVTTGSDGTFQLTLGVPEEGIYMYGNVQATGYYSTDASGTVYPGPNDVGDINLWPST